MTWGKTVLYSSGQFIGRNSGESHWLSTLPATEVMNSLVLKRESGRHKVVFGEVYLPCHLNLFTYFMKFSWYLSSPMYSRFYWLLANISADLGGLPAWVTQTLMGNPLWVWAPGHHDFLRPVALTIIIKIGQCSIPRDSPVDCMGTKLTLSCPHCEAAALPLYLISELSTCARMVTLFFATIFFAFFFLS